MYKQIKELWYIDTMEYYEAIINDEILQFTSMWMELKNMLSEEERQLPDYFTHLW